MFFPIYSKGQLISKCPYEKSVWTKIATKIFPRFLFLKFTTSRLLQNRVYRVVHKFSDTRNELFVANWLISKFFWGNNKWKKVSSPHYLKIPMKLSKHGISYSLQRDPRSISKITFYANLRVSPIDTELWYFFQKNAVCYSSQQYLGLNEVRMALLNNSLILQR